MSRSTLGQWVTSYIRQRRCQRKPRIQTRVARLERLGERITPTVNAIFTGGQLIILGDAADNTIVVSRNAAGAIQVNDGVIPVRGGTPTIANTTRLQIFGLGGDDQLTLDESNGLLPAASLFGGAGDDALTGGSRNDLLFGQAGNDVLFGRGGADRLFGGADNDMLAGGTANDLVLGEQGNDIFVWNSGDARDVFEGGAGVDSAVVNGSSAGETFAITANGPRVQIDNVNEILLEITAENLRVNGLGGDDVIRGSGGLATLTRITMDGGAGNDGLVGGDGDDMLLGGDGADIVSGGRGNDVAQLGSGDDSFLWNAGEGNDQVEGQAGRDQLVFRGSAAAEVFELSANGNRLRLARNLDNIALDVDDVEQLHVDAGDGSDSITVNDLSATDVTDLRLTVDPLPLSGVGGFPADTITIKGTAGADVVQLLAAPNSLTLVGLATAITVDGLQIGNDLFVFDALAGNDVVNASALPVSLVNFVLFGGIGNDTLQGSQGVDAISGGDGDDFVDGNGGADLVNLGAGNDTFRWDVGDASDQVEGAAGLDTMVFNGFVTSEMFELSANGNRLRLTRNLGNIVMDVDDVERVDLNASNGQDVVTVNDLTNTDVTTVNISLEAGAGGAGDGLADTVIVNGRQSDDSFQIASFDNGTRVAIATTAFPFISIKGGEAANDRLVVNSLGGDDLIDAASLAANAIALTLNGGAGNDELSTGGGNDLVNGGTGDDTIFLGTGNDTFVWATGEGNDTVEGNGGADRLVFIGSDESENVRLSANGNRLGVLRNAGIAGSERIDLNDVEQVDLNVLGGADTIFVNELSATDVTTLNLNLKSSLDVADGQADAVILTGTDGDDLYQIASFDNGSRIAIATTTFPFINITGSDGATDRLVVNTLGGDDVVDAASLATNSISLTLNGGAGNDQLSTGGGNDLVNGGAGTDMIFLGFGDDTFIWNPGDGNDIVEGSAGRDKLVFNGDDSNENVAISHNGGRARFTRNVGNIALDLDDVEQIDFNALGGADTITVNDLTGTDVVEIDLNLVSTLGGTAGDGQVDSIVVNGTAGDDVIPVLGNSGGILVNGDFLGGGGLAAFILVRGVEAADSLRINGGGGDDVIAADDLETPVRFSADGGEGNDILTGTPGNDLLLGGAGDDTLIGGPGLDVLDGGPGNNTIVQD